MPKNVCSDQQPVFPGIARVRKPGGGLFGRAVGRQGIEQQARARRRQRLTGKGGYPTGVARRQGHPLADLVRIDVDEGSGLDAFGPERRKTAARTPFP